MKRLVLLLLLALPLACHAQTEEPKYYIYNIVSFEGDFTKEDFKVFYDDGTEVKRFRDEKNSKMKFKTPAAALMFFLSQGWEMYLSGATSTGSSFSGTGSSKTSTYWILRKPCTKEEFDKAVKNGIAN